MSSQCSAPSSHHPHAVQQAVTCICFVHTVFFCLSFKLYQTIPHGQACHLLVSGCRGDLLMAHCHPLFMVQSIYQPPDKQLASQAHSPEVLVVLAKIQQHPNSQQQGRKPLQSLVALVVTHDNLFVGANIGPKVSESHHCWLSLIACPLKLGCKLLISALLCSNDACFPGCVGDHQGSWPVGCELPITRECYVVGCSAGV